MGFKRENTLALVFTALQICVRVPQTQHRLRQLFHKALKLASSQQFKAAMIRLKYLGFNAVKSFFNHSEQRSRSCSYDLAATCYSYLTNCDLADCKISVCSDTMS